MFYLFSVLDEISSSKLESIYYKYKKLIYIVAYSILKDIEDSQDIVQEVIIRISKSLEKIDEVDSNRTKAYLSIISRNLAYDKYNARKKVLLQESDYIDIFEVDNILMENDYLQVDLSITLSKYINELPQNYSDIITLRYYYALEVKEISEILGISSNNVRVRLTRALKSLKEIMYVQGVENEECI